MINDILTDKRILIDGGKGDDIIFTGEGADQERTLI